jgi:hypothetical protein
MFSKFVQEQMVEERKNELLVEEGKMLSIQADKLNEKWEMVSGLGMGQHNRQPFLFAKMSACRKTVAEIQCAW